MPAVYPTGLAPSNSVSVTMPSSLCRLTNPQVGPIVAGILVKRRAVPGAHD
jgi:hypothetical protein